MSPVLSPDPMVSIITVCLNSRDLIEKTIKSVISQSYPNIQYIIIDGGSTDGTLDVIEKYRPKIDVVVSEKDDGIYYAMNKSCRYAKGDIIYFLNSGDYLCDTDVVKMVCTQFKNSPESDVVYGDIIYYDEQSTRRLSLYRPTPFHVMTRCGICHQALFAKKHLLGPEEPFDTKYHIYADYKWLLKSIFIKKCRLQYIEAPIAYYKVKGMSQTNPAEYYHERVELMNHFMKYLSVKDLVIRNTKESIYFIIVCLFLHVNIVFYRLQG